LDILGAALGQGKASRLYKVLVYDKKLAQEVSASQNSGSLGSRFEVEAIAQPGVSLDDLEKAIDAEAFKMTKDAMPAEELARVRNVIEAGFVRRLESVRERASLLNAYQAERGDPGYAEKDLARYTSATSAGVRDVAAKYIVPNARVILRVVPKTEPPKSD